MDDEFEIPELGPRQPPGKSDEAAKLLSRVKNALRADGLYPGRVSDAGVAWDVKDEVFKIRIEVEYDPEEESDS